MMRWLIGLSAVVLMAGLIGGAPAGKDLNGKTGVLQLSESDFNFGSLPQSAEVTHNFELTNVGNDTLNIIEIKPGCGCTTAPVDKTKLGVRESTQMRVTYRTGTSVGPADKGIIVRTDQKPRGQHNIYIKAYVESPTAKPPDFFAVPRYMNYSPPKVDFAGDTSVELVNNSKQLVKLKLVGFSSELGTAQLARTELRPGEKGKLTFKFNRVANRTRLFGYITLDVITAEEVYRYTVPVIRDVSTSTS